LFGSVSLDSAYNHRTSGRPSVGGGNGFEASIFKAKDQQSSRPRPRL